MFKSSLVVCAVLAGSTACAPKMKSTGASEQLTAAAGSYSENDMTPEMKSFRDKWMAVTTPQELHALLNELETALTSAPSDLKYFGLQIVGIKDLRGAMWRLSTLADDEKVIHSFFLTAAMGIKNAADVFAPYRNWQAMTTYISEPIDMPGEGKFSSTHPQFQTVDQLQVEIVSKILPKFQSRTTQLEQIAIESGKPLVWDNSAAAGKGTFVDALDRFEVIGEAEKSAALAVRYMAAHNALVFASRNLNDFAHVSKSFGSLWGFDGSIIGEINGSTMAERVAILRRYPNYLTLRDGAVLQPALEHLRKAVSYARKGFSVLKSSPGNEYAQLNSSQILPFSRLTEGQLSAAERIVAGSTALRSRVTGEVVNVNVPAMYTNPARDLKVFLPTSFSPSVSWNTNQSGYRVRNYNAGSASAWNAGAFQPYFPSITSSADVEKTARILSQSWGGGILAFALGKAIN